MLPPILSHWLATLIGWWRPAPCLVRPATPSMISHTARIQERHHAHPSLELVPVAAPPLYHNSCTAIRLQPQPTAADLQAKRQPCSGSIAELALHPDFWLASEPRATIGCVVEHMTTLRVFTGFPGKFVVGLTTEHTHLPCALPCHFYTLGMSAVLEHSPVSCNQHTPAGFLESLPVFNLHLHPGSPVNMALGNDFVYHNQVGHGHGVLKEHWYNTESNMLILTVRGFFRKHILHSWHSDATFYLRIPPGRFEVPLDDPPKSRGQIWQAQPEVEHRCSPDYKVWREY